MYGVYIRSWPIVCTHTHTHTYTHTHTHTHAHTHTHTAQAPFSSQTGSKAVICHLAKTAEYNV